MVSHTGKDEPQVGPDRPFKLRVLASESCLRILKLLARSSPFVPRYTADIGRRLRMKRGHLSRSLTNLVLAGFVAREGTDKAQRVFYRITAEGLKAFRQLEAAARA